MASFSQVDLDFSPDTSTGVNAVVPVSGVSKWKTAITAGGLTTADPTNTAGVVDDLSSVTDTTHKNILSRETYEGTTLRVRMQYHDGDILPSTAHGPLRIRVFGSVDGTTWGVLRNLNGDASTPIITDPDTDPIGCTASGGVFTSSSLRVTQPDNNAHSWDCDGYNLFFIVVEVSYAPASGTASAALLEARVV